MILWICNVIITSKLLPETDQKEGKKDLDNTFWAVVFIYSVFMLNVCNKNIRGGSNLDVKQNMYED